MPTFFLAPCALLGDWNVTDGKNGDSVPFADGLVACIFLNYSQCIYGVVVCMCPLSLPAPS